MPWLLLGRQEVIARGAGNGREGRARRAVPALGRDREVERQRGGVVGGDVPGDVPVDARHAGGAEGHRVVGLDRRLDGVGVDGGGRQRVGGGRGVIGQVE